MVVDTLNAINSGLPTREVQRGMDEREREVTEINDELNDKIHCREKAEIEFGKPRSRRIQFYW